MSLPLGAKSLPGRIGRDPPLHGRGRYDLQWRFDRNRRRLSPCDRPARPRRHPGGRASTPEHIRALLQRAAKSKGFWHRPQLHDGESAGEGDAHVRSLTVKLPPGMIGNPQAAPPCPWAILVLGAADTVCPDSVVGVVRSWVLLDGSHTASPRTSCSSTPRRSATSRRDWRAIGVQDGKVPPLPIVFAARQRPDGAARRRHRLLHRQPPEHLGLTVRGALKIDEQDITLFPLGTGLAPVACQCP